MNKQFEIRPHSPAKILVLLVMLICSLSPGIILSQNIDTEGSLAPDMSSSLSSLKLLCEAIASHDIDQLAILTTPEGFEAIYNERGVESLIIDVLFWKEAIANGRIFVSEKIESEKEYILLQDRDEYEILCIHSPSEDKMMLIEKLTFVLEDGQWKFLLFSAWEKE